MARKNEVSQLLIHVPWWRFLAAAPVGYLIVAYGPSIVLRHGLFAQMVLGFTKPIALFVPFLCVALAIRSALMQHRARKLFDRQTGIVSVRAMTWSELETLVAEAYRRQGYAVQPTGGAAPDGGIDIVIKKDGTYLVQCKLNRPGFPGDSIT